MPIITEDDVRRDSGDDALGAFEALLFSDTGGLTQFGAFVEILQPGANSSHHHWHEEEDEMVYLLEGEATLVEGEQETLMQPGTAATFRAGVDIGHRLENRSDAPVRYLVIGTRAPRDRVHYPRLGLIKHVERRTDERRWSTETGAPADPPPR